MSKKSGRKHEVSAPAAPPLDPDDVAQAEYASSMREYRKFLEQCESEATSDFDRTTVALSGGALGIAMAFLKDVPPATPKWAFTVISGGLIFLVVSLLGVLLSLMASRKKHALRAAVRRRQEAEARR